MEHFQEYLATEVALDHVAGQLTRREALRRLGMMGVSSMAGAALLAACAKDKAEQTAGQAGPSSSSQVSTTVPTAPRAATTPVPSQAVTYPGPNGTLMGAYSVAARPKGAVLVVHENRGLVEATRAVVARLAGDGYSALAVDLLSEEGGTAAVTDVSPALNGAGPTRIRADLHASVEELGKRSPGLKTALIGFCFGGTVVWDFLADGEPRLSAAAPFYGTVPPDVSFAKNTAAVLGIYGETDARVNATREAARTALDASTVPHVVRTYPGVGHGFYSDVGSEQSKAAYTDVIDWFDRYLK